MLHRNLNSIEHFSHAYLAESIDVITPDLRQSERISLQVHNQILCAGSHNSGVIKLSFLEL